MDYMEIAFTVEADCAVETANDLLASALCEVGFDSFIQQDDHLVGYIPSHLFDAGKIEEVLDHLPMAHLKYSFTQKLIPERDWNETWEQESFKPVDIDGKCLIRPVQYPSDESHKYNVSLQPKMAFGSGFHETTRMMISLMMKSDIQGRAVLDMGCGTGVLAIVAAQMKARRVMAIDNDSQAVENAKENVALNQVDSVEVVLGDAQILSQFKPFDFVFANINRNILLRDMHEYVAAMNDGATLFLSGFLSQDLPLVEACCKQCHLTPAEHLCDNEWIALKAIKG